MTQKDEPAYMTADNDHPEVTGAGIVKVMILALLLLLIGEKFGLMVSLTHLAWAVVMAALLYFLWRGLKRYLSRHE